MFKSNEFPFTPRKWLLVGEPWMVKTARNTWEAATFPVKVGSNAETAPIIEKILGCMVTWALPVEQGVPSQRTDLEGG